MIIHHIPIKPSNKRSSRRLIEYLLNPQGKQERVGKLHVTNCQNAGDINWGIAEIEATQAKNTRAKCDQTYHVVISFAPGEEPSSKVLQAIEQRVVASIGLSEHQRISVVHHDTDSLHVHLAINKIHPKSYRMIEPYHAYKKFAEVAIELEQEFSLVKTNHIPKHRRSESQARDMEHHSGIESLISRIKKNCLDELIKANSWDKLHKTLAASGLAIKRRGNGFVFFTANGLEVKGSSISRHLSKPKLEQRLGPLITTSKEKVSVDYTYTKTPINKGRLSMDLYEKYEAEKTNSNKVISDELRALSSKKKRLYEKAKKKSRLKRQATKLMKSSRASKKVIHALISRQYNKEATKIQKQCSHEREKILGQACNLSWADWLQKKAQQGSVEAIEVLRQKAKNNHAKYGLKGPAPSPPTIDTKHLDSVTKNGTVIYKMGECTVKDDGKQLNISRGISLDSLKEVILMARQQYGRCITAKGSDAFKKMVVRVAVRNKLDVTFSEKKLERFKQELTKEQEKLNERKGQHVDRDGKRIGCSNKTPRCGSTRTGPSFRGGDSQPHPNRFRGSTPAEGQDGLPDMSQLNVAQFPRGSKMLLSDNAHNKLELKRTKPDNKVRRCVLGWKIKKGLKKT